MTIITVSKSVLSKIYSRVKIMSMSLAMCLLHLFNNYNDIITRAISFPIQTTTYFAHSQLPPSHRFVSSHSFHPSSTIVFPSNVNISELFSFVNSLCNPIFIQLLLYYFTVICAEFILLSPLYANLPLFHPLFVLFIVPNNNYIYLF